MLKGVVGEFFSALCLTLGISVLLSFFFAVAVIPLLSQRFLSGSTEHAEGAARFIRPVIAPTSGRFAGRSSIGSLLWERHWHVWCSGLSCISMWIRAFCAEMDEGGYVLDVITPAGTSLDETNRFLQQIEQRIAKMPETDAFSRRTGAELGLYATEQNKSDILVKMKPLSMRKRSTEEVMDDLRQQIAQNVPGVDVEFAQILQDMLGDLEGSPSRSNT